jgi:hypothetical protein
MREPAKPNASNPADPEGPGLLTVSIPDRRRIDSDVRALLRQPSTPWIVFDREGRPPSQLAVGEVLPAALSSVIPDHGFFPATAIIDAAAHYAASRQEPSSLAVAADLAGEPVEALGLPAIPARRLSRRILGAAVAGLAMVATVAFGAASLSADAPDMHAARSSAHGSPVPADVPPPQLDVKAERAVMTAPAAPAIAVAAAAPAPAPVPGLDKRFSRLSITGDARSRDVFLDGKRLLGHGARSFTVTCGAHSIAVGTRADAHTLDAPCGAELVLSK